MADFGVLSLFIFRARLFQQNDSPCAGIILTKTALRSTLYYRGGVFMSFSIRLTDEERLLAESYARLHSYSLSEAFKKALFEKIEDEYDVAVAQEAYNEYIADGRKSRPLDELWKECDL